MTKAGERQYRNFVKHDKAVDEELRQIRLEREMNLQGFNPYRKTAEGKREIDRRAIIREHVRRFGEVFETAKTIEMLDKLPAKLGIVSVMLGFFSFFSTNVGIKVIYCVVLILLIAAALLSRIIRRDYRYQLVDQLADAMNFSRQFKTGSKSDLSIYQFARTKL